MQKTKDELKVQKKLIINESITHPIHNSVHTSDRSTVSGYCSVTLFSKPIQNKQTLILRAANLIGKHSRRPTRSPIGRYVWVDAREFEVLLTLHVGSVLADWYGLAWRSLRVHQCMALRSAAGAGLHHRQTLTNNSNDN